MTEPQGWFTGPSAGLAGATGVLRAADYATQRLRELGIRLPPNSRLDRARARVASAKDGSAGEIADPLLAEATRTVYELYFITRAMGGKGTPDKDLLERWGHILGGPDLPGDETDSSAKARNTQFELFVGAWLTAGGVPVRLEEPDLRMLYYGQELGIAVKRVRSRAKFVGRACDGAEQIEEHTEAGVVAINVDHLLDGLPQSQDSFTLGRHFDDCVPEYDLALDRLRSRNAVKAFAAMGTQVAWNGGPDKPVWT